LFHAIVIAGSTLAANGCNRGLSAAGPDAGVKDMAVVFPVEDMAQPIPDLYDNSDFYGLCPQCFQFGQLPECPPDMGVPCQNGMSCHTAAPDCQCYPCYV
jgi:hypothetical protein